MQRAQTLLLGGALTAMALIAMPALLSAQDPAAVVKERQDNMKKMGDHMKAINAFVEGGTGSAADVATHAAGIKEVADKIPSLFPEGTSMDDGVGKTGAKPVIWTDWADFESHAKTLSDEAAKLSEVAATGDGAAIGTQFAAVGKNGCGGCHQTFRQKLD
jgi:cytochrome c556